MKRLAIILTVMGGPVGAQIATGNAVYDACQDLKNEDFGIRAGYCIGYVAGAWEGIKIGSSLMFIAGGTTKSTAEIDAMSNQILRVCLPQQVDSGQLLDVYLKYLTSNPATRHEAARYLLLTSLQEAFPCE